MVSRVIPVEPFDLVIFGGTGDLARRKILPGLFRRFIAGQMPQDAQIIGAARAEYDADGYRQFIKQSLFEFGPKDVPNDVTEAFLSGLDYVAIDAKGTNGWPELAAKMRDDGRDFAMQHEINEIPRVDALFIQRKLGGVYLLAHRLRARVDVNAMLLKHV